MDTKEKNEKKHSANTLHKVMPSEWGDLENKRASTPPRADSYFGNAQL